ncbi:MAG: PilZ domain-containing protein [Deltaproteobacteria bacterium]|nr:PilZ domain-containing protein [Deltaproteobacteria bacterium]
MSAKPPGGKKPDFFEIKESIMIAKIFDIATRHHIKVTVWLKNQSIKFETELSQAYRESKMVAVDFPPEVTPESFDEAVLAQASQEILGSFQIDQTNFFFKTVCHPRSHPKLLRLSLPQSIYKLQRRVNLRIPFSRQVAPKLTMFDPGKTLSASHAITDKDVLAYRMLDISAGGCGIAAKLEEKAKFKVGTPLHDIRFSIRGMDIVAEGHVKHVVEISSDVGKPILKVGIQFQGLKMQFDKHIVKFVLDESRKLFTLLH